MNSQALGHKVYSFCHTLRDDGVSYGDYLEQLTYLIFLKMAHEFSLPPYDRDLGVPEKFQWPNLVSKSGAELESFYILLLRSLGDHPGMLGKIYTKSQNRINDPAKLQRLVKMIDETSWTGGDSDTLGDIYEDLLERNAADTKTGAGQYFTPRALISVMVACIQP